MWLSAVSRRYMADFRLEQLIEQGVLYDVHSYVETMSHVFWLTYGVPFV